MSDTPRVFDGSAHGIDGLADTPIYLAMTAAATPIFHAMTVERTAGHRARPAGGVPPSSRHRAQVDDPWEGRDPLTAPLPIQSHGPRRAAPRTGHDRPTRRWTPQLPTQRSVPWGDASTAAAAAPLGSRLPDPGASWGPAPRRTGRHRLLVAVSY